MKSTMSVEKKSKTAKMVNKLSPKLAIHLDGKSSDKSSRVKSSSEVVKESQVSADSNQSPSLAQSDSLLSLSDFLPSIKESLLFQKSQILNRTNEFKRTQQESVQLSDEAEVASNDLSNNLSIHLHERSMKALMEIDKALNKISQQTYGDCEGCGDVIHPKRLQARPLAPLCISCMEEREEERRIKHQ